MAKGVIKAPFFEIGPKSYLYGDDVLELALAADKASEKYGVEIIPVDSKHSAIFQCLMGSGEKKEIKRLILTCSGGPFFGMTREQLQTVTKADALSGTDSCQSGLQAYHAHHSSDDTVGTGNGCRFNESLLSPVYPDGKVLNLP